METTPFQLPIRPAWLNRAADVLLGLSPLRKVYDARPPQASPEDFLQYTMSSLDVGLAVDQGEAYLEKIPKSGPLLIVANHPLGGLEGVLLAKLLMKYRPDLKVLTNELLRRIPELAPIFIGVDVLSSNAAKANAHGLRQSQQHLQNGGALLLFPSGTVASLNVKERAIEEKPWHRLAGMLLKKNRATCLPIYVKGRNSRLFYGLGLLHPLLRTAMLARELSNKRGKVMPISIGAPIEYNEWRHLESVSAITHYLRLATETLGHVPTPSSVAPIESELPKIACPHIAVENIQLDESSNDKAAASPVITHESSGQPVLPHKVQQSLLAVADCILLEQGDFSVYCVPFPRMQALMPILGIAREITFRAAGEGSGKTLDIDQFDPHYQHLFIWDNRRQQIAGGYRMGHAQDIVAQHGLKGLYSRSLYRFDESFLSRLGGALEVGRSFVHPDYQCQASCMDLLWRGIGAYVTKYPQFHTLFGAVSISREHSDLARAFISESMLQSFRAEQQLLQDVTPLVPLNVKGKVWTPDILASINKVSVINKLVGRCDPGKTLPTLIRHYLSLNGRFVCFSVNEQFSEALDGLIVVDLRQTPQKYLQRYLGKQGSEQFLQLWSA